VGTFKIAEGIDDLFGTGEDDDSWELWDAWSELSMDGCVSEASKEGRDGACGTLMDMFIG